MATIKQAFNTGKVYIGWYGVCPETGENACVPFDLINAENEHTILPETGTFSVGITGPSRLINSISSFKNTNAVGYNGKETSTATNSFSTLKQLTCGEAYVIYVVPGTDAENLLEFTIPEFVIGNIESDEKEAEEYILTTGCGTGGVDERTPTPSPSITTSPTETPSPSPSPSATETPSPSPSPSATETPSPSPSPSPSITPSPTITTSPSPSPSPSITPSPTITSDLLEECCAEGLNEFNVTANTEQEFGSSIITTTTAFTDNVTICVGNPTGGLPFSVKLKKNSDIVGVLTSVGEFDDDTIYYTESNGVCRTCIIEDDECVLEFIPTRDVPNQPQPPQPPPLCCEVNMISHKITNTSEIETDDASSDTITISAISNSAVNGTLCYGYSTGGVPYSVHVKLNDASLCVLTTTGTLNNNKIYFNQDNVCYDGIIDGNNECNLQ